LTSSANSGVDHFVLIASPDELERRRIERLEQHDETTGEWSLLEVSAIEGAHRDARFNMKLDTERRPIGEVAAEVIRLALRRAC